MYKNKTLYYGKCDDILYLYSANGRTFPSEMALSCINQYTYIKTSYKYYG